MGITAFVLPADRGQAQAPQPTPTSSPSANTTKPPAEPLDQWTELAGSRGEGRINSIDLQGRIAVTVKERAPGSLDDLLEIVCGASSEPTATAPPHVAAAMTIHFYSGTTLRATQFELRDEEAVIHHSRAPLPISCDIDSLAKVVWGDGNRRLSTNDPRWTAAVDSDRLLTRDGDRILSISGFVTQVAREFVMVEVEGEPKKVASEALVALIFAAPSKPPLRASRRLELVDGSILETNSVQLADSTWSISLHTTKNRPVAASEKAPPADDRSLLQLPRDAVRRLSIRSPRVIWLNELDPIVVDEGAIAGTSRQWRRNRSVLGTPMRLGGQAYDNGLGVRARSHLEYKMPNDAVMFAAVVGIDDAAEGRGDCEIRLVADGMKTLFHARLRGGEPPRTIAVPLEGCQRLSLRVDPGEHLDLSDFVDWVNARVIRPAPRTIPAP